MRAAVFYGRGDLRLEDVPEPVPGPGEVKIRLAHNGLCGTDLHLYFAEPIQDGRRRLQRPPDRAGGQVFGHEFAGTVEELGSGLADLAAGDRVCVLPMKTCLECDRCLAGMPNLCLKVVSYGLRGTPGGGLAEYVTVPERMAFKLPDEVSLVQGALVEPMSVAFNAVQRSGIGRGATAVVMGAGAIGIGAYLGLRAMGVEEIIVVEPSQVRRDSIELLGAPDPIDPSRFDVFDEVMARTAGRGADAVLECAGVSASFLIAPEIVAARGRVVVPAVFERPVPFHPHVLIDSETEVVGAKGYTADTFSTVIGLMAQGLYPIEGWVERVPFEEVISSGLEGLRRGGKTKVVVDAPGPAST
jgi:(R,R)-butanediol dehydrogenase/meso-butanediol dehydrogenase/diacetyl reductase